MIIIWIGLFIIIVCISLILAFHSMRDYVAMPINSTTNYSLYLVKNEAALNEEILTKMDEIINQKRLIVSFERLYKGSKQALVVYGPVVILKQFTNDLDLMELEDYSAKYSKTIPSGVLSWEISSHDFHKTDQVISDLIKQSLTLEDSEELWWQLVIQPKCEKNGLQPLFKAMLRVVVIAQTDTKARNIKSKLDLQMKNIDLLSLPQVFSSSQMMEFYQKRSLPQMPLDKDSGHFVISLEEVKDLFS